MVTYSFVVMIEQLSLIIEAFSKVIFIQLLYFSRKDDKLSFLFISK